MVFILILIASLGSMPTVRQSNAVQGQSQVQQTSEQIQVVTPPQQYVKVISPESANVSVVSVSGGLYQLALSNGLGTTELQFSPVNSTVYSLVLRIASNGSNYAYVEKQGSPFDTPLRNFSSYGSILLSLTINSSGPISVSSGNWDPLFGMTGLHIQAPSLNFDSGIIIVSALGIFLIALGLLFHSRISYLGVFFLLFMGAVVLGLLVVLGIIVAYVASFALFNFLWRYVGRRSG